MKILVVKNKKQTRDYIKRSLEAECYVVDTARDGQAGIYLALTNNYDLITLDNLAPVKSCIETCRQIRKSGNSAPMLILSVESEIRARVDLLNAGADDYLIQPFSIVELLARIKALLRRPRIFTNDLMVVDNLEVDLSRQIVKRGGSEIYLTRKEFTFLKYMINNQGEMLSRSMIMEHVWDTSADPFSNTIEAHVVSLRKKIDLPNMKKLIHTVPGRGYRFE